VPAPKSIPAVSPARIAAFEILLRVEKQGSFASELLHSQRYSRLSIADHGLATELVMGVLRWRSVLDADISRASEQRLVRLDVEVLTALRLGIYQLHHLPRIPARAVIYESVELVKHARKRSASSFVNAVLRKVARAVVSSASESASGGGDLHRVPANQAKALAFKCAHPPWLVNRWIAAYGIEVARKICEYDQKIPTTTVRLREPGARTQLAEEGVRLEPGLLLSTACQVEGGNITNTRAFREGSVAIQDEASQLVAFLLGTVGNSGKNNATGRARILDCCAAPGGKTSILAERNPEAQIFAIDLHPRRASLTRRLVRNQNVGVVAADVNKLPFASEFERILVDAPCSGTGTLARNPEIKWRLDAADIFDLQGRQKFILQSALRYLAPGGRLLYSTCSLEKEENADVIDSVLAESKSFRLLDCKAELQALQQKGELTWKDLDSLLQGSYLRTLQGVHPGDGFFAALIERVSD